MGQANDRRTARVAVCDDDRAFGDAFARRLKDWFEQAGEDALVDVFTQAKECCLAVERGAYELLFLDIEMEGMDGFGAARRIGFFREGRKLPYLVFVSAHENLVFDAYEFEPFWFMRKSRLEELDRVLERFQAKRAERELSYRFKDGYSYRNVRVRDILFLEGSGHSIEVNTYSNRFSIYGSLAKLEADLKPYGFFRVHRNYLVNMDAVFSVDRDTVTLVDYTSLPMSKDRKAEVKARLLRGEENGWNC